MRRFVLLVSVVLSAGLVAPSPAAAAPGRAQTAARPDAWAAFDKSIEATKAAMMRSPEKALPDAEAAIRIAATLPPSARARIAMATAQWLHGEALLYLNQPDRAAPFVAAAIRTVETTAPNTKLHGDLMRSRGAIAAMAGRVQPALADFQRAHDIFQAAGERRSQAIALQDIGMIYQDAQDYDRVLRYYTQSAEVFSDDPSLMLSTHNNKAQVLRETGRYDAAVKEYQRALGAARALGSPVLEARILSNLAWAHADAGNLAAAQASVSRGLKLAASGEAQNWRPALWGVAARIEATRGRLAEAARYLEMAFKGVDLATTPMPFRDLHQAASEIYRSMGQDRLALDHLTAFKRLDDEARALSASTNAQLMSARFDFANQDLKISRLKAGQLERDVLLEKARTRLRTTILSGVIVAGGVIFSLLLYGYVRIRRSRDEVRAANASLSETNTALEKALAAKTEFLATTSHEIRTPLNGILGMTQVLLADRAVDQATRAKVELVHGAGETMRALVDDLLDVAKMETGEVTVAREEVDLARLVDETRRFWAGQAEVKKLTLAIDTTDAPCRIIGDDVRLRQVLFNLMSNAIKFTEEGAVTLRVAAAGDRIRFAVTDTGIGIDAAEHEAIFEPFKQVDGGTTRKFAGTGLGLSICRKLVLAFGGKISVDSALGQGATFTVDLPLELPAERARDLAAEGTGAPTSLATASVLMIEGNPIAQSMMRTILAPHVRTLQIVGHEDEALAVLDEASGSGIEHVVIGGAASFGGHPEPASLRRLVERAHGRGAIATILTGSTDAEMLAEIARIGADQVLTKPIGAPALVAALQSTHVTQVEAADRAAPVAAAA